MSDNQTQNLVTQGKNYTNELYLQVIFPFIPLQFDLLDRFWLFICAYIAIVFWIVLQIWKA